MTEAEFQSLLARASSGESTSEEAEALLAFCRANPAALAEYVEQVRFERELRWVMHARDESGDVFEKEFVHRLRSDLAEGASFVAGVVGRAAHAKAKTRPPVSGQSRWPVAPGWLALAACLAFLALVGFEQWRERPVAPPAAAVLSRSLGVVWKGEPRVAGEALSPGWLALKAGALELEFAQGARVVIEGPAEFQVVSDHAGFLRSGKLRALVPPPAHGFSVRGPGFAATDLGTEFGCQVAASGLAEVHVFTGEVRVEPASAQGRLLEQTQALRLDGAKVEMMAAQPGLFLSEAELAERVLLREGDRLAAWRISSRGLDANAATLFHFDFEQGGAGARTLPLQPSGASASIVGCEPGEGRWRGKGALGFTRAGDRLRLSAPGDFHALTLIAWVRVDDLPQKSSLLMSDAAQPGEVHWYFYPDGSLIFGVNTLGEGRNGWRMVRSPPVLPRERFGSWIFAAVTYDEATGLLTHYFNGRPVIADRLGIHIPLRLGDCELGNWGVRPGEPKWSGLSPRNQPDLVRNFHGRMDEFAALRTALSPAEIERLYESGQPGD